MASSNWKKVELAHCRELGGERTGPMGRDLPDCTGTPGLGLEIKAYKRFVFLTADWEQAVRNAAKLGVIPALLVREGGRGGRKEVQLWANDWYRIFGADATAPPGELIRVRWDEFASAYRYYREEQPLG